METTNTAPYVLDRDEGEHRHFLNHLATVKVSPGTTGSMAAIEFVSPRGFGPPVHCHHDEDELMIVHDGEIEIRSGDLEMTATAGATVFLPKGVPHTFQIMSESARFTAVSSSSGGAPQFGQMVAELGEPLPDTTLPEPVGIDPTQLAQACQRNGIEVLGPPPAPLD